MAKLDLTSAEAAPPTRAAARAVRSGTRTAMLVIGIAAVTVAMLAITYTVVVGVRSGTGTLNLLVKPAAKAPASTTAPVAAPTTAAPTNTPPPTPSYVTPSLTVSLPPPETPTANVPIEPVGAVTTATPAAAAPQPAASSPAAPAPAPSPAPAPTQGSLSCSKQGKKVVAVLSYHAASPVNASVTAGGTATRAQTVNGDGTLSATANNGLPFCSATLGAQQFVVPAS